MNNAELKPKRSGNYHHNGNIKHGLYKDHKELFNLWQTMAIQSVVERWNRRADNEEKK